MYVPKLDDYVKWKDHEGWVYFQCSEYITIELGTKLKDKEQIVNGTYHRKDHILLVCPYWLWNELEYIKHRRNKVL